jgi:hypothetical protein
LCIRKRLEINLAHVSEVVEFILDLLVGSDNLFDGTQSLLVFLFVVGGTPSLKLFAKSAYFLVLITDGGQQLGITHNFKLNYITY